MKLIGTALLLFPAIVRAAEEPPDLVFLEWLGQMTEVEELGVDIEQLLLSEQQESDGDESKAESQ